MALMCLVIKLCSVTVMLSIISLTGSQEILFELKDRQYQEILFSGDVTVAMVCKIITVNTAEVKIINSGGELVTTNNGKGNCLEFVISRINSTQNLNYTCSVSYKSGGGVPVITENVSNREQSCFRNGTGINKPYQTGDVLLLSCYCRVTEPCGLTETVVGSMLGRGITPFEEEEYNNKKIRRIIVGPFNDTSIMTLRYDCSRGTTVESRCSTGPAQVSAKDFIINPTNPSVGSLECPVTEISTKYAETFSSTDGDTVIPTLDPTTASSTDKLSFIPILDSTTASSTDKPSLEGVNPPAKENNESFLTFIIVLVGIFALLIVSVAFLLVFIVLKRKKKGTKATKEGQEVHNLHQSIGNMDQTFNNLDQNADNQDQNVDIQDQNVDGHAYVGNVTDDSTDLPQLSDVSDGDVVVTDVMDGRDIEEYRGTLVSLPVDNNGFDNDDGEDPEDQFQTADTSDYSVLVAFMKRNNMQKEQDEVFGLDAEEDNLNQPE
ncbi:hypothetical protein HOLleu_27003 [Holothuria leucospilota]|uniref:Uncharacterized protein n=1 Tax=Holothuria leucospilota TaxID=206669 RepID=A0A9Q1BPS5_HOLLE|nr:hypothetical protein HOLleu_27003 [Holothuria leucospilota]